jgi:hypothetical protein
MGLTGAPISGPCKKHFRRSEGEPRPKSAEHTGLFEPETEQARPAEHDRGSAPRYRRLYSSLQTSKPLSRSRFKPLFEAAPLD